MNGEIQEELKNLIEKQNESLMKYAESSDSSTLKESDIDICDKFCGGIIQRTFYIDVTDLSTNDISEYMGKVKSSLETEKKHPYFEEVNYYIAVKGSQTRMETILIEKSINEKT